MNVPVFSRKNSNAGNSALEDANIEVDNEKDLKHLYALQTEVSAIF